MNGPLSERIKKREGVAVGVPEGSYWEVVFSDDSSISEKECDWSSFSKMKVVEYFGMKKQVLVSKYPIKEIRVFHDSLSTGFHVERGMEVYQALRSQMLVAGGKRTNKILGRCVGIVSHAKVLEEHFLNGIQQEVMGMKS